MSYLGLLSRAMLLVHRCHTLWCIGQSPGRGVAFVLRRLFTRGYTWVVAQTFDSALMNVIPRLVFAEVHQAISSSTQLAS